ncbi:hypothetical protein J416_09089 [Gracilibacillus halophilus YIM-C55.5]|uniref:Transglutaminase-like domain-containing protein n=1 Tax=Gracilibacillus halophilus YIM-C55.5 TaxID=1308866 RepID=N4WBW8_9BACI|nr:transglutaminase domain-containing protein [Gracilibacillus halophilus]ENH96754.1 hypothetical protein J416_09089 [Gracilibacillus halophilus YIM-C55.5]
MKKQELVNRLSSFIVLLAGFLLFWEWLRPLEQITDTGSVHLFVVYAALSFVISYFIHQTWLKFIIKSLGMVLVLDYLFIQAPFASSGWIERILYEFSHNVGAISDSNWYAMTPFFRSFLFLLLLWLMSYLLHYWFIVANKIFLFIVLTIVYLAVLDTFTVYDAKVAIVRSFIIAFVILGLNYYAQLVRNQPDANHQIKGLYYWMIAISSVVIAATAIGFFSPKFNPQWPDPVPFIQSTAGHIGFQEGNTIQKVGYDENDSNLGGSFVQDDTTVFEVITNQKRYWRIESKDVYTGKGWERSSDQVFQPIQGGQVNWRTFSDSVETEETEASIRMNPGSNFSKIAYPYGLEQVEGQGSEEFYLDKQSGMIEVESSEQQELNQEYAMTYQSPSYDIDELRASGSDDPQEIQEQYLQLPDELPNRVGDLAAEIVESEDSRYGMAKAIEGYFGRNGFTYQTKDVPVPGENEDYVDQFLFESKIGYCDNFSTSMVVLLRSVDIPARWVKGFTGGELQEDQPDLPSGYSLYEVTNNNAHSWVEVYFPGTGWVPFEPTAGFANNAAFHQDIDNDNLTDETQSEEEQTEETEQEEELPSDNEEAEDEEVTIGENQGDSFPLLTVLGIIAGIVVIVLFVLWIVRRDRWKAKYLLKKWDRNGSSKQLEKMYIYLLQVLQRRSVLRDTGQSLRQYAKQVDEYYGSDTMYELTLLYEQSLYRQAYDEVDRQKLRELFEKLFRQIFA